MTLDLFIGFSGLLIDPYLCFMLIVAFVVMTVGSITDFDRREVPDWINYALLFTAILGRLVFAIVEQDGSYLLNGFLGFLVFTGVGMVMFYGGQWGGGDAKMMMGLGTLFGISLGGFGVQFSSVWLSFLINSILLGCVYGLVWSFYKALSSWRSFNEAWRTTSHELGIVKPLFLIIGFVMVVIGILSDLLMWIFVPLGSFLIVIVFTFLFAKSVERACMIQTMKTKDLTEGEWVNEEVWIKRSSKETLLSYLTSEQKKVSKEQVTGDWLVHIYTDLGLVKRATLRKKKLLQVSSDEIVEDVISKYLWYAGIRYRISLWFDKKRENKVRALARSMLTSQSAFWKKDVMSSRLHYSFSSFAKEVFHYDPKYLYIAGPDDLGILNEQIALLKKHKIKSVIVKVGIPFVPSFWLGFVATVAWGNPLVVVLGMLL
jgi:prepilin signal peptidase PulO-like enzyme (type II secretory pathway)